MEVDSTGFPSPLPTAKMARVNHAQGLWQNTTKKSYQAILPLSMLFSKQLCERVGCVY